MNLPNKLTLTRIILVPVFFALFLLVPNGAVFSVLLLVCYAVQELTDLLDGKIARKRGLVSDLGKVFDPFADVICHLTYFSCFVYSGIMPLWCLLVILWREFSQTFMRMLMMGRGKAVAANIWGKSKTVFYAFTSAISVIYITLSSLINNGSWNENAETALYILFSVSAVLSVLSFATYVREIIKSKALSGMTR